MNHKILLIVALLGLSFSGYSQLSGSIGLKGSYDQQFNILDDLYGNNESMFPDFSVGFDASIYITDWLRIRGELKYANVSFTRKYDVNSDIPKNIDYTKVQIHNMNINPYVDFRLLNLNNKFEVYYSLGAKVEFAVTDRQRAFTYDDEKLRIGYVLDEHKDVMLGNSTGLLFKYNVNEHWGITLFPEYTVFWGRYYSLGDRDTYDDYEDDYDLELNRNYYMRGSLNFGIEYTF